MPTPPLSDETCREAMRLVQQHGTMLRAMKATGIDQATLRRRALYGRARGLTLDGPVALTAVGQEEADPLPRGTPYEREWQTWQSHIGALKDRYQGPQKRIARTGRLKIVVLSDLHAPFQDTETIARICHAEADADIALILGDLGDGYSLSRFIKYETVPYEQELAAVTQLLERFSETWPLVKLLEGNHDSARLERRLRDQLPQDFISAILSMTGGTLSPLVALAKRFPNVELCGHTAQGRSINWMTQIGDAIFCHAEKFSITPGAALRKIEDWLSDMEGQLGLEKWRVVIQAHTHQLGMFPWAADKFLIECGCLCTVPGYAMSARIGGRPQRRGYVTLEQVDGRTDINSIRMHWLDGQTST